MSSANTPTRNAGAGAADKPPPTDPWLRSGGTGAFSRETFEGASRLLRELEIFGWLRFRETLNNSLRADRHPGALEIHYMKRGHLRWWVGDEAHDFGTGCVFIVKPGELHGGDGGAIQPCEHYWLRLRLPEPGAALPSLSPAQTADLAGRFAALRPRTFQASPRAGEFFQRLHEEHRAPRSPETELMARSLLHALLVTILRDGEARDRARRAPAPLTWQVRRAKEWLDANYREQELRVDRLSRSFGRSATALRSRFKLETGYTPHEYVQSLRIGEARRALLETDRGVTDIAHALGFSSSQYFATVFRRRTGMTPSEFRARRGGAA
ncbi:MAG: AraC family transcriptional regulator [Opitutaceae bacterium]|nr:AraC family transcriptional regulator [Opitutaceae bacterium]